MLLVTVNTVEVSDSVEVEFASERDVWALAKYVMGAGKFTKM